MSTESITAFSQLALSAPLLKALEDVGYETPSPIQAQTIPILLEGKDLLGQAQTGTGKTAAFALPLLSRLNLQEYRVQVLVLAPTRELAIQVAEAFQKYAKYLPDFHVLPIYGGQDYRSQLRALKRGVHVVVGTPGRVMDHMRRGTLVLDSLRCLVLDEADEMLRMGFIDDVKWVLEQTPVSRQIALFSATMPAPIRHIASQYLNRPSEVTIDVKTATADTIRQRYWLVSGTHKLDALTRILEVEPFDAMIIFVRTKIMTSELADKLEARGYACAALHGDIAQNKREAIIEQLKTAKLDILVATDVAARGLDVGRISHVLNYDIPYDSEAYIHRIGRTGRAGRQGDAILFVAPREKRLLSAIEKATRHKIEMMALPSTEAVNDKRIARLQQRVSDTLAKEDLDLYHRFVDDFQHHNDVSSRDIAAALAHLLQVNTPLLRQGAIDAKAEIKRASQQHSDAKDMSPKDTTRRHNERPERGEKFNKPRHADLEPGMQRFRIEVGKVHDVKVGSIVGAIANEAGIDANYIGRIDISDEYSLVDLPEGMPREIFQHLKRCWVAGRQLQITRVGQAKPEKDKGKKPKSGSAKKSKPRQPAKAHAAKSHSRKPGKSAKPHSFAPAKRQKNI